MHKARYLETTSIADVEELLHSNGPDLVMVRGAGDPAAFTRAQGHEYPHRQQILEDAVSDTPGLANVVASAGTWLETRFPGLLMDGNGFRHDATAKGSSAGHVDTAVAERRGGPTVANQFRGPLSLSVAVEGNATWRAMRVKPYAVRPNAEGMYKARRFSLMAKEITRTCVAGKALDLAGEKGIVQRAGDFAFFASLPWHTYHSVVAAKGRKAELYDMNFVNDPRYWG